MGKSIRAALAMAWLAACAAAEGTPAPRAIRPAEDVCARCHMTVDDATRAAQWVAPDGRALLFDEAGCLVEWRREHPDEPGAAYVSDAAAGGWVRADSAFWVRTAGSGAMGSGLEAFRREEDAAERAAVPGARRLTWAGALAEEVDDAHAH